jgi:hypothetical protein
MGDGGALPNPGFRGSPRSTPPRRQLAFVGMPAAFSAAPGTLMKSFSHAETTLRAPLASAAVRFAAVASLVVMTAIGCVPEGMIGEASDSSSGAGPRQWNDPSGLVNSRLKHWVHSDEVGTYRLTFQPDGRFDAERADNPDDAGFERQTESGRYEVRGGHIIFNQTQSTCGTVAAIELAFGRSGKTLLVDTARGPLSFQEQEAGSRLDGNGEELCLENGWLAPRRQERSEEPVIEEPVAQPPPPAERSKMPEGYFRTCVIQILNPTTNRLENWDWDKGDIDLDGKGTYHFNSTPGAYSGDESTGTVVFKSGPLAVFEDVSYRMDPRRLVLGSGAICERTADSKW